jgi:hypothetical protein
MQNAPKPDFLAIATKTVALAEEFLLVPLKGKSPELLGQGWPSRASREERTLKQWAKEWPEANAGIVATDRNWHVDVDMPADEFLRLAPDDLPPLKTLLVRTGGEKGGLHIHFKGKRPDGLRPVRVNGDTKNTIEYKQQVVAPGSIHPDTGHEYKVVMEERLSECPAEWADWFRSLSAIESEQRLKPRRLKREISLEDLLKQAGLKYRRVETNDRTLFAYHNIEGQPCLVAGKVHDYDGQSGNVRQCAFYEMKGDPSDWGHTCFDDECSLVPCQRTKAIEALGIRVDRIVEFGMSLTEARNAFKSFGEMDSAPLKFLVKDFIPAEIPTMLAALPGNYKTFVALSICKAMASGNKKLWGYFDVPAKVPCLYLIPEAGEKSLRHRMGLLGMDNLGDDFLARTLTDGPMLALDAPEVVAYAQAGYFLAVDTTIRFVEGDENSASDNRALAGKLLDLVSKGAAGVLMLHHSPKSFRKESTMNAENSARGTGDFAALCGACYALKIVDQQTGLIQVECTKPRDFEGPKPFQLTARPFINLEKDLSMTSSPGETGRLADVQRKRDKSSGQARVANIKQLLAAGKSKAEIAELLGIAVRTLDRDLKGSENLPF